MFILIPRSMLLENSLTLLLYVSTKIYGRNALASFCEPIQKYMCSCFGTLSINNMQKQELSESLEILTNYGYFKKFGEDYIVQPDVFQSDKNEYFIKVDINEYNQIMEYNCRSLARRNIFHHFCNIISSFDWNIDIDGQRNIIGHMPISYFAELLGTSKKTIENYNKILEQMELIYIGRGNYTVGSHNRSNNVYCRFADRDLLKHFTGQSRDDGNFRRSVMARYNIYQKEPTSFPEAKFEQLKQDVEKYNLISNRKLYL